MAVKDGTSTIARPRRSKGGPAAGETSLREGFLELCGPLVGDLLQRRSMLLQQPSPANVHALRGALRRMRAALGLFGDLLPAGDVKWIRRELKWFTRELGLLRDLDVLVARLDALESRFTPQTRPEDLMVGLAKQARRQAETSSLVAASSARASMLAFALGDWCARAAGALADDRSLNSCADPSLFAQHARITRDGAHIGRLGSRARHRLRRRIKCLRYSAESLARVKGVVIERAYLATLIRLSQLLGDMNDDHVGAQLVQTLSSGTCADDLWPPDARRRAAQRKELKAVWAAFETGKPPGRPLIQRKAIDADMKSISIQPS
ncbi:MAG TPA: CHAD domain-containing protein [Phenylobacterium sp.]